LPLSAFYEGYGKPDIHPTARFRQEIYKAMHIGTCAVASARENNKEDMDRADRDLREIARSLPAL